jgi:hypothetical protein
MENQANGQNQQVTQQTYPPNWQENENRANTAYTLGQLAKFLPIPIVDTILGILAIVFVNQNKKAGHASPNQEKATKAATSGFAAAIITDIIIIGAIIWLFNIF